MLLSRMTCTATKEQLKLNQTGGMLKHLRTGSGTIELS